MRVVFVLMDTLRRDVLSCYNGESRVLTPNLDAFARESTVFDEHWVGSAPCMPARRDIMTGRLNFLERCWGPVEPFDVTLPKVLSSRGVFTHITTDHAHYMELGGEGYLQQFDTWDFHRGQEWDPWVSRIDAPAMPHSHYGRVRRQYQWNRTRWEGADGREREADMPSPRTFASACEWIRENSAAEDFFLHVEAFDPHEPFDVPDSYMDLYGGHGGLDRDYFEIPVYGRVSDQGMPRAAVDYLQRRYAALVTMTDAWFGRLVDTLKEEGVWDDALIIVTTDHGFFLGERDYLGKNFMHLYNELARLPLLVRFPGGAMAGERVSALTQNIDVMPTVLDFMGIDVPGTVQGKSWRLLVGNPGARLRDSALYGYHAMAVNVTDGRYTYFRAPVHGNKPCYNYTASPSAMCHYLGIDDPTSIDCGRFLPWTDYPVFRIPVAKPNNVEEFEDPLREVSETRMFDLSRDPGQLDNLAGRGMPEEDYCVDMLERAMEACGAPEEQFVRLGLEVE